MSEAQMKATDAFADINKDANDKGLNRWQRRQLVKTTMRGKSFGGAPRVPKRSPAADATVRSAISAAEKIIAGYAR